MTGRRTSPSDIKKGWSRRTFSLFCCLFLLSFSTSTTAGPLSERVVFVAPVRKIPKILVCRPDGRDLQRLSKVEGIQREPFFSPALQRFFFVREVSRRQQIASVDIEGNDLVMHTSGVSQARQPTVDPSGKKLIYSTDIWGSFELAELDLETGTRRRLTYDQGTNTFPRFSPDGQKLLYLTRRHGQSELYLLNLADSGVQRLTDTAFPEGAGSWRPDGKRILATRVLPPKLTRHIFELDLETGTERLLLSDLEGAHSPTYSSDGSLIVFIRNETIFTYDPSDTVAMPFPMKGTFNPTFVRWVQYPLP